MQVVFCEIDKVWFCVLCRHKTGIILGGMREMKFTARFYCKHVSNKFNGNALSGFEDCTWGRKSKQKVRRPDSYPLPLLAPRYAFGLRTNAENLQINICLLSNSPDFYGSLIKHVLRRFSHLLREVLETTKKPSGNKRVVSDRCTSQLLLSPQKSPFLVPVQLQAINFYNMHCCVPLTCFCSSAFWSSNIRTVNMSMNQQDARNSCD